MSRSPVEVVHVGSASRDIADDDPRGWRLGGGVTYAALTTARLGLRTAAVIGVDSRVARGRMSSTGCVRAGVDLLLVPLGEAPVFHNVETAGGRRQTCLAVGRPLEPLLLPASWRAGSAWSFTPVADEVPDGWTALPSGDAIVAVGWQGMLRRLRAGAPVVRRAPAARALLTRAPSSSA